MPAASSSNAGAGVAPPTTEVADEDAAAVDDDYWALTLREIQEEEEGEGEAAVRKGRRMIEIPLAKESAFLVGFETKRDRLKAGGFDLDSSLDELERLADTAGLEVVGRTTQRLDFAVGATLVGSGKIEDIIRTCVALRAETIIFDSELSPRQARNIEQLAGSAVRVCDRTALILDIFAQRAASKEGKLQVLLAQAEYQLPRLTRLWSHLDRVGGAGQTKGTGESQLQIDKRLLKERVRQLKEKLEGVKTHRSNYRERRAESGTPVIALAGYTNAGKSSLLNALAGAAVFAEDKLFATLDPTSRGMELPNGKSVLMTDTVGFIQNLPTQLVAAFRGTLEEIQSSSLILHVVDASQPNREAQIAAVEKVLADLDVLDVPVILAFNKMDALRERDPAAAAELEARAAAAPATACFSALTGEGLPQLLALVEDAVAQKLVECDLLVPYAAGALVAEIRRQGAVEEETFLVEGIKLRALLPLRLSRTIPVEYRILTNHT